MEVVKMAILDQSMLVPVSKDVTSVHMGTLLISVDALEHALYLPEGYKIKAAYYQEDYRRLKFVLESSELPETKEGERLPELDLLITIETLSDQGAGFSRYSGKITF
jgi:hypothetical protein